MEDLFLELTRAANYICDKFREYINPTFRYEDGIIFVESGPYLDLTWRRHRVEYRENERTDNPYPGLEEFKKVRNDRDFCFGIGINDEDPQFLESRKNRGEF